MNISNNALRMLELMDRPGFIVKENTILHVNRHAEACGIKVGTSVLQLLNDSSDEYTRFAEGSLSVHLQSEQRSYGATVEKLDGFDLFLLDEDDEDARLNALAMTSQQLRIPLSSLMLEIDDDNREASRMLCQLHRAVSNMSDALRYRKNRTPNFQTVKIDQWFSALVESISAHTDKLGIKIQYTPLQESTYCSIDEEMLERAILNIISNSLKAGSTVLEIKLTKQKKTICFTIKDNGKGIHPKQKGQLFTHYQRIPCLGDADYGMGLGMVIIQAAATAHKGTVLLEYKNGLCTTLTISIMDPPDTLRSPILCTDYLGGRDHILTELSDVLPSKEY